jgi:pyrophosphatase PpaX
MIKAILFDVDGTLLDTEEYILRAFEHVFATFRLRHLSRSSIEATGQPLEEAYKILVPELDTALLCETHRAFQDDNVSLVKLFKNTAQTLDAIRARGIKTAAVTSRKRAALESLAHAGIEDSLDYIVTGNDVRQPKPHPEGLFKALRKLEIPAPEAIMVGDSQADMNAGKNAGTATAAALYGLGSRQSLEACQPDHFLTDISELLSVLEVETLPSTKPQAFKA